jgi:hypothetical protein
VLRHYNDLYFERINVFHSWIGLEHRVPPNDISVNKSLLLQHYTILATSFRAFGSCQRSSFHYENLARQIAGELIDDFSIDSFFALQLLAFHFWGSDSMKSSHYRAIAMSVGKQMLRSGDQIDSKLTDGELLLILRLQLAAICMQDFANGQIQSDLEEILRHLPKRLRREVLEKPVWNSPFNTAQMIQWARFRCEVSLLSEKIVEWMERSPTEENAFTPRPSVSPAIFDDIRFFMRVFTHVLPRRPGFESIAVVAENSLWAFCQFGNGNTAECLGHLGVVVNYLRDTDPKMWGSNPMLVDVLHLAFRVALAEGDFSLASRLNEHQRQLAEKLPSAVAVVEGDLSLFETVIGRLFSPAPLSEDPRLDPLDSAQVNPVDWPQLLSDPLDLGHFEQMPDPLVWFDSPSLGEEPGSVV